MDEALRRAERDATDREGAARLLVARVRAGALPAARLQLAAYLGHREALAAEPIARPNSVHSRVEWIADLHRFGHEAPLRAGLAALSHAFAPAPGLLTGTAGHADVIAHERRMLEHIAALRASVAAWLLGRMPTIASPPVDRCWPIDCAPAHAVHEAARATERLLAEGEPDRAAREAALRCLDAARAAVTRMPSDRWDDRARAVRADLLAWALGERDPLLDA